MYLNTLSSVNGSKRLIRRLGRGIGSGLGKTCGRGCKGQKSRSGARIRRGFEGGQMPLYRRLPKFGFRSSRAIFTQEVSLSNLNYVHGDIVDLNSLKSANIISNRIKFVKIILSGKIHRKMTIHGLSISKGARIAIKKIGGNIITHVNK